MQGVDANFPWIVEGECFIVCRMLPPALAVGKRSPSIHARRRASTASPRSRIITALNCRSSPFENMFRTACLSVCRL